MLAEANGESFYLPVVQMNDFPEEQRGKILLVKEELGQVKKRVTVAEPAEVNPIAVLSVSNQIPRGEVSMQSCVRIWNVGKDGNGLMFSIGGKETATRYGIGHFLVHGREGRCHEALRSRNGEINVVISKYSLEKM